MAKRKGEKNKSLLTGIIISVLIIAALLASGKLEAKFNQDDGKDVTGISENIGITVHFLDVGQGDSEFIELPDGQCMLIDAGESSYGESVSASIRSFGYSKIDYLVATHPHSDHIGGLKTVIDSFEVGNVYMPRATSTSGTYETLLKTIMNKGLKIKTVNAGLGFETQGGAYIEFLSPAGSSYDDLNNFSAVLKLTYKDDSYLFTGDAEALAEKEMLDNYAYELDCDVLKVGHHGSKSSSSKSFINAVSPDYAVISCGQDNSYGHPNSETLETLESASAQIYRTDELGTVVIRSEGDGIYEVSYEVDS